jgi:TolB-like protein
VIYRFEHLELDVARHELRTGGAPVPVEPQVFAVLWLLIANRERVVTREELLERVWPGRVVSESAVASRIKSARHAIGDDGTAQRAIRTIHGVGFRFVGEVQVLPGEVRVLGQASAVPAETGAAPEEAPGAGGRPSLAVLPFEQVGDADPSLAVADALPHDLITELSRLRWLFVIARGSTFRFRGAAADLDQVRLALNVRYALSGAVELRGSALTVSVELSDLLDRGVVWGERFRAELAGVHEIREEIVRVVIAALELRIPVNEARRAQLAAPERLDAWAAYHLGLRHMYRFTRADNEVASGYFQRAVGLEPGFARAHAGLSFTHFQSSFLRYARDVDGEAALAHRHAEACLERDPLDPFGAFTLGRALWLRGDLEGSLPWLERATTLSPSYAQAHYARAFSESLLGRAEAGHANVDAALALSPLDPLLYGFHGVRAFAHLGREEHPQAAAAGERAATSPGAHALLDLVATIGHQLNGDPARARSWAATARARSPDLTVAEFFRAFPFRDPATRARLGAVLTDHGF